MKFIIHGVLCLQLLLFSARWPSQIFAQSGIGSVSGTVFDADTGLPVPFQPVELFWFNSSTKTYLYHWGAITNGSGQYTIAVSNPNDEGVVKVAFGPSPYIASCTIDPTTNNATYCEPDFFMGATDLESAQPVTLSRSTTLTNINGYLKRSKPVVITYRALDVDTLQPIEGATLVVWPELNYLSINAVTGITGEATLLVHRNQKISTKSYPSLTYRDPERSDSFTIGSSDISLTVYMMRGRIVQGVVRDMDTGQSVSGVFIEAYCLKKSLGCPNPAPDSTFGISGVDGSYKLLLAPGENRIVYDPAYSEQYYPTDITRELTETITTLDIQFKAGSRVSGSLILPQLIDPRDQVLGYANIHYTIFESDTGKVASSGNFEFGDGMGKRAFISRGLPSGTYKISFDKSTYCVKTFCYSALGNVLPYFSGKVTIASADVITVTTPQTVTEINAIYTYTNLADYFPLKSYLPIVQ